MSSEADICNRGLSEIGARVQITDLTTDTTPAGVQCRLWYGQLRKNLLRTANWGFGRFQVGLTLLGDAYPDQTAPYPYLFKYAYPSDAIKLRYILPTWVPPNGSPPNPPTVGIPLVCGAPRRDCRWQVASDLDAEDNQIKVILSNVPNAIMVYTKDITNPDLFDNLFETGLSCAIGSKVCLSLTGNTNLKNSMMAATEKAIVDARAQDGNEGITFNDHTPDWIQTRGWPPPSSYSPGNIGWGEWWGANESMNWSS